MSPPQTPAPPSRRRSSIADLFQPRSTAASNANAGTSAFPSAISTMQSRPNNNSQNHPRRMSVSTALGVAGSPTNQTSPFSAYSRRRDSVSSSQDTGSPNNEDAIMEDFEGAVPQNTPVSPFARRVSFGAQAFGSVKSGSASFSNGEGFNWGDNFRERTTRVPQGPVANPSYRAPSPPQPRRAASVTTMEPPKQMPPARQPYKPDQMGERMLRGDFMMD